MWAVIVIIIIIIIFFAFGRFSWYILLIDGGRISLEWFYVLGITNLHNGMILSIVLFERKLS